MNRVFLAILAGLLSSQITHGVPLPQAKESTWVGKTILLKKPGIKLMKLDAKEPGFNVLEQGELTCADYKVLADADGWIKVRQDGTEGWLAKTDAVLLEDAVEYFTGVIEQNANDACAFAKRGWAWQIKGEANKALNDYNEAIRLNSEDDSAFNNRGVVYFALREVDKAIENYDEAIRLNANNAGFYNNRAIAWSVKKDFDKAISDFDEAIRLNANNAGFFNNRGMAWSGKKDFDKAISDFGAAIELEPKNAVAFHNRGDAWSNKKDYEKAIKDYNQAISLDPKAASALTTTAWLLATCPENKYRDGKKAVELARKACELRQWKDANDIENLAVAHAELGDFSSAIKYVQKALEDTEYKKNNGAQGAKLLALFKQKKPYRDE